MTTYKRLGLKVTRANDGWTVKNKEGVIFEARGNKGEVINNCLIMLNDKFEFVKGQWEIVNHTIMESYE